MQFPLSRRTFLRGAAVTGTALVGGPTLATLTSAEQALAAGDDPVDLDILFIGAHPDDEASTLSALGQWNERLGLRAGVITVTRGEGGGNSVGLEEGPPLGLLREAEERRAVAYAGIEHVFNLDGLDFYYTASAPLSDRIWGGEALLNRIVRVVRATRPSLIVTMNPAAVDGNHGNHQQAAKYAVEAYFAAADPARFPEHRAEGFGPWRVGRIVTSGAIGKGETGPGAVSRGFTPADAGDVVFGTWRGNPSTRHGETWMVRQDKAMWEYVTQGWRSNKPSTTDPAKISVNWFTLIDSRTPFPDVRSGDDAVVQGACRPVPGGLPGGVELVLTTPRFEVLPGRPFDLGVRIGGSSEALTGARLVPALPTGWTAHTIDLGTIAAGETREVTMRVTPTTDAAPSTKQVVGVELISTQGTGRNLRAVEVVSPVRGQIEALPEIATFRRWTAELGVKQLDGLLPAVLALGSGRSRSVRVTLTNHSDVPQTGAASLGVPTGFSVTPAERAYGPLAPGATTEVTFEVTNTDVTLPTANRAPDNGRYPLSVRTRHASGEDIQGAGLNLVPVLRAERAATAPTIDGRLGDGEYPGAAIDVGTLWEGEPVTKEDCSGWARVTYDDEALYVLVDVTDDVLSFVVPPSDAKRQRRVDSVEISIDPRHTAENTSTVFIAGIFPILDDPANGNPPGFGRDRDQHQGPGATTAPGTRIASVMKKPYTGYTIEARIPFSDLPDAIDPANIGFNVTINDSDTQDKVPQSRVGWSTWAGVRADPYRWGILELPGLPTRPSSPRAPIMPDTALHSTQSPQSIDQSATDRVPLGGWSPLPDGVVTVTDARIESGFVTARVRTTREVVLQAYAWDGSRTVGHQELTVNGEATLRVPLDADGRPTVLLASARAGRAVAAFELPLVPGTVPSPELTAGTDPARPPLEGTGGLANTGH